MLQTLWPYIGSAVITVIMIALGHVLKDILSWSNDPVGVKRLGRDDAKALDARRLLWP